MAIRNRHGTYDKFVKSKLVPGEFAFVRSGDPNAKDGKSIYASFDAGTTKRLATYEDMKENIALAADDVVNEVAEELNAATDRANTSAVEAETAATNATNAAEEAKHAIAGSKSPVYKSDGWPEVGEEGRLYIDDTVSPRLIYTWDDVRGYVPTGGSGGGGNATVEEMTWAEYEALSEEEKMDGTLRVITDRKAGVRFGNVDISDIGDGTVTGAISAINSNLSTLKHGKISCPYVSADHYTSGSIIFDTPMPDANYQTFVQLTRDTEVGGYIKGVAITTTDKTANGFKYSVSTTEEIGENKYYLDWIVL